MKTKILLFFLLLSVCGTFYAQQGNILYYMDWVPHANHLNPAKQHPCDVYVGIPGINNIYASVGNNALSYKTLFVHDPVTDSVNYSFSNPEDRANIFMPSFHSMNYIDMAMRVNWLSIGTRSDNGYFVTFDFATRADGVFSYTEDFATFIGEQAFLPDSVNQTWSGTGCKINLFNEFSIGWSRRVNKQFAYGVKAKILLGIAHASMNMKNFDIYSSPSQLKFNSDFNMKVGAPDLPNVQIDSIFSIITDSEDTTKIYEGDQSDLLDDLVSGALTMENMGFGLDLGVIYNPTDEFEVSASIIDLGFIRWGGTTLRADSKGKFTLEGEEINSLDAIFGDTSFNTSTLDTILDIIEPTYYSDPFYSMLTGKIYVGARYFVHENIALGLLSSTRFYNWKLREAFTVSANFYPVKWFSGSISYTMAYHSYNTMGVGLNFKPGPINLYMIADHVPLVWTDDPAPYLTKYINFRFGMNIIIGCGKKIKDVPMID